MGTCIDTVYSYLAGRARSVDDIAQQYFPDKPATIVPVAISLALITESDGTTTLLAANLDGDSGSVASIGGAIAGALCPLSVNEEWFRIVQSVNSAECGEILMLADALAERWPRAWARTGARTAKTA